MTYSMLHGLGDCTPKLHCGCLAPTVTDNARAEQRSGHTVQQTAAHFARKVQRVSDRIRSTDYQRSVSDIVALDNVEGFLDRIARDDLDVFAAGRAEAERPACTWPRCKSPATGKCFAWCKCICHEWSAAHRAAGRAETTTATVEDAVDELRAWAVIGDGITPADDDEEWIDRTILSSAIIDGRTERIEGRPETIVQRLAAAGLLATARTRPTREAIEEAIEAGKVAHDDAVAAGGAVGPQNDYIAQEVDALLNHDQPTEAEAGARALVHAAGDHFRAMVAAGAGNPGEVSTWLRERAARLRGGAR